MPFVEEKDALLISTDMEAKVREEAAEVDRFIASATDDNVDTCNHAKLSSLNEPCAPDVVDGIEGTWSVTKHALDATTLDATTFGTDGAERRCCPKGEP